MNPACHGSAARSSLWMRLLPCACAMFGLAGTPAATQRPTEASDLAAAQRVAFPDGMQVRNGEDVIAFDESRLIEAPFGPVLVSRGTVVDASHATPGRIAIHYLRRTENGFAISRAFPLAIETGSHGAAGDWSATRRFTSYPAIYVEGGGTWQGYTCSVGVLTELTPERPVEIAAIPIYYDNQGTTDRPRVAEGRIANIRRGQSFDVVFTGTARFTEHYVQQEGRFVRTSEESRASC